MRIIPVQLQQVPAVLWLYREQLVTLVRYVFKLEAENTDFNKINKLISMSFRKIWIGMWMLMFLKSSF